jgi:periplasmic mercuric ion binding protein
MGKVKLNLVAGIVALLPFWAIAADDKAVLDIKGMNCASCPITVRLALKKVPGVSDAKVHYKSNSAEVSFDAGKVTSEQLAKTVRKTQHEQPGS